MKVNIKTKQQMLLIDIYDLLIHLFTNKRLGGKSSWLNNALKKYKLRRAYGTSIEKCGIIERVKRGVYKMKLTDEPTVNDALCVLRGVSRENNKDYKMTPGTSRGLRNFMHRELKQRETSEPHNFIGLRHEPEPSPNERLETVNHNWNERLQAEKAKTDKLAAQLWGKGFEASKRIPVNVDLHIRVIVEPVIAHTEQLTSNGYDLRKAPKGRPIKTLTIDVDKLNRVVNRKLRTSSRRSKNKYALAE